MNYSDSLSVCVTNDQSWEGGQKPGARWLDVVFDALDKEALFFKALGVFDPAGSVGRQIAAAEWNNGKRWEDLCKRSQAELYKATESLPMLRRFEAEYEDVAFASDEINSLREECTSVKARSDNPDALASLDKLLRACDEALRDKSGLFFASD